MILLVLETELDIRHFVHHDEQIRKQTQESSMKNNAPK